MWVLIGKKGECIHSVSEMYIYTKENVSDALNLSQSWVKFTVLATMFSGLTHSLFIEC